MVDRRPRLRVSRSIAPIQVRVFSSDRAHQISCQIVDFESFQPLAEPPSISGEPSIVALTSSVTQDWVSSLWTQAYGPEESRLHELPLVDSDVATLPGPVEPTVTWHDMVLPPALEDLVTGVTYIEDLFQPLGWTDVDGKHYGTRRLGDKTEEVQTIPLQGMDEAGSRKSYELPGPVGTSRTSSGIKYKSQPSFWDEVYPLLQPPLGLNPGEPYFLPHPLYPFQYPGVQFLRDNESALLGDEMGTGKTVQAIVAMRLLFREGKVKRALVVSPVSVLREWDRHLMEWSPELLVTVVHGQKQQRPIDWGTPAHVYLTTYGTLRNDVLGSAMSEDRKNGFDLIITDEIQYIKNVGSKRSQAMRRLSADYRWGLSGTPMENTPEDIVSIYKFLRPGLLREDDPPHRLRAKMAPYFLRRRKKDVLPDLPPKRRQQRWLDLDSDQRRAYREWERRLRGEYAEVRRSGRKFSRVHIFSAIQKFKQICNFAPGKERSPKTRELHNIVDEVTSSGNKAIVFSQYVAEGVTKLEALLEPYGVAKIVGGQGRSKRESEIARFRRDDDTRVLVASVKSGGVGLTLTEASYVIHFDHWWNPAVKWQAEDRVHRPGQEADAVNIYEFWVNNTIDERIYEILGKKERLFDDMIESQALDKIDDLVSEEEFLEVLGLEAPPEDRDEIAQPSGLSISEVQSRLQHVDPYEFEDLVGELLKHLGYSGARVSKRSGDKGIDVSAWQNTTDGRQRVAVQCKRYSKKVGVKVARELVGVVAADPAIDRGLLVTTAGLTWQCRQFVDSVQELDAIEGTDLARRVRDYGLRIPES